MTVIANRHTYAFDLAKNAILSGDLFEIRFRYPERAAPAQAARRRARLRRSSATPRTFARGDFVSRSVWDDGRYTYFAFAEGARQPAIFKVNGRGRERTVNWTQQGDVVRVLGTNPYWTLRIGDEAICVYRDTRALTAG
jgi:type IV secretion system protein VirB9